MMQRTRPFILAALAAFASTTVLAADRRRPAPPPARAAAPAPAQFTAPALDIVTPDRRLECPLAMEPPVPGAPLPPIIEYFMDPKTRRLRQAIFRDAPDSYVIALSDASIEIGSYYVYYKKSGNMSVTHEKGAGVTRNTEMPDNFAGLPVNYLYGTRRTLCATLVGSAIAPVDRRRLPNEDFTAALTSVTYGRLAPTPPESSFGPLAPPEASIQPR